MEATPTNVSNSAGWQNNIIGGGGRIDPMAGGFHALLLAPGNTDQFVFDSTETISQLEGPSTEGNKLTETTSFYIAVHGFSGKAWK